MRPVVLDRPGHVRYDDAKSTIGGVIPRTVAARREPEKPKPGPYPGIGACEFCRARTTTGVHHDKCPGEIHTNPGKPGDKVWTCQCWKEGHP